MSDSFATSDEAKAVSARGYDNVTGVNTNVALNAPGGMVAVVNAVPRVDALPDVATVPTSIAGTVAGSGHWAGAYTINAGDTVVEASRFDTSANRLSQLRIIQLDKPVLVVSDTPITRLACAVLGPAAGKYCLNTGTTTAAQIQDASDSTGSLVVFEFDAADKVYSAQLWFRPTQIICQGFKHV